MAGPDCLHCDGVGRLVTGREVYPGRPDLWEKPIWQCPLCRAYVGCHPGTRVPLGRPADQETRRARMILHNRRLDRIWKGGKGSRRRREATYAILAHRMGLDRKQTHTALFDLNACRAAWAALEGLSRQNVLDTLHTLQAQAEAARPVTTYYGPIPCPGCGKVLKGGAYGLQQHMNAKGCGPYSTAIPSVAKAKSAADPDDFDLIDKDE